MVGGFSKKHRLRMGGCPSLRCRNLFRMPLTGHLREAHQIWLRLGFHQDLSEKTRKVKNQIQMMSPEKSVNEINPYFTNLVLKRFKKTVQKIFFTSTSMDFGGENASNDRFQRWVPPIPLMTSPPNKSWQPRLRMTHGGSRFLLDFRGIHPWKTLAVLTSGRVRSEVFWQDC